MKSPSITNNILRLLSERNMLIFWKILCIVLLSLGATSIGYAISKIDLFLFLIGLLLLISFILALKQAREDAGFFSDQ